MDVGKYLEKSVQFCQTARCQVPENSSFIVTVTIILNLTDVPGSQTVRRHMI